MPPTGSTKIPYEIFYGEKPKIIGLFSEFGRVAYVMKRGGIRRYIKDKRCKGIMVGYKYNHTRGTYKL